MAGFSSSIQERYNRQWRPTIPKSQGPVNQTGFGKKLTKKRQPEKHDLKLENKFRKTKDQKRA